MRQIGAELRRYRLAARLTTVLAAERLHCSHSKISKIESGRIGIRTEELRVLLDLYRVPAERATDLIRRNDRPRSGEWWRPYRDSVPDWFQRYLSLEAAASRIACYQPDCVPGLLQTEAYARAVLRAWEPDRGEGVLRGPVELRMARQRVLHRPDPVRFTAVLGEAALRRVVGDRRIMRDQLDRLVSLAESPNIELRVLPFDGPPAPVVPTAFVVLGFPERDNTVEHTVAYLEDVTGANYLDKPAEDIGRHNVVFGRLRTAAADPAESRKLIAQVAREFHA